MIEIMSESTGNLLAVRATKTLTQSDYTDAWIPALKKIIEEHKKANIVFYMDEEFEGWELEAMWEDAKFGYAHKNDFDRIVVVGGPKWVKWGTEIAGTFMNCKLKTYKIEELAEATAWASKSLLK
ncbi:MAG: universal stress protein UspA [Desulfovibrio sp. S3730MH75]|nr:MAG: universal stress protein UspA [Desulfovibrio sp. S3730MH75]